MMLRSVVPIILTFALALPFIFAGAPFIALAIMGLPFATLGRANSLITGVRMGAYFILTLALWGTYAEIAGVPTAILLSTLQLVMVTVLYAVRTKAQVNICRKEWTFTGEPDKPTIQRTPQSEKRYDNVNTDD